MEPKESIEEVRQIPSDETNEVPVHWQRWRHVILSAESLVAASSSNARIRNDLELVLESLVSMEEVFPKATDPLDDVPGYAFRQYCKALHSVIDAYAQINPCPAESSG